MLDLVLILESAGVGPGGGEGGDEDFRGRRERRKLSGPSFGLVGYESGELGLRGAAGNLGRSTGDCVDATDARVGQQAGEDVGSLCRWRLG